MSLPLTTSSASFFGTVFGSFFYGLFFILSILSTVLRIQRITRGHQNASRRGTINSAIRNPMIMAGFMLFLTVTARWILDIIDTAYGLLEPDTDPQTYFLAPGRPRAVSGFGVFAASLVICDTMIVYRLWIVWNKSTKVVIFPLLTLSGMLAFGIGVTRRLAFAESLFSHKITRWLLTDIVFNLVTNIYCTGFIAYRIYTINSKVSAITRAHGGEDLMCVTAILIESSALLSAWIVFGMITYAIKSVLEIFVLNTLATVAGISFMLINVRGALGWGHTNQSITGFSVNRAYPGIPSPSMATGVRMETQVDIHVHMDMPTNSSTDDELKLGAESEDQS